MSKKLGYGLGFILIAIVLIAGLIYRYQIHDWWVLRAYTPSSEVSSLASRTAMSDKGRDLFYVHDPQVLSAVDFNSACPDKEASVVLGCFNGRHIYVYKVENKKLDGVKEITAAHEMLHAAYARFNDEKKTELAQWLTVARTELSNQRIKNVISSYGDLNQDDMMNELHSIFGTEVRGLPDYLEKHYQQYFNNRGLVLDISENYESVFENIQLQIKQFDEQLATLSLQIRTKELKLENLASSLNSQRRDLENYLSSNQNDQYNAAVPAYNNSVNNYNSLVASLKNDIDRYNSIVNERNLLGAEQNNLVQSIDSHFNELERE